MSNTRVYLGRDGRKICVSGGSLADPWLLRGRTQQSSEEWCRAFNHASRYGYAELHARNRRPRRSRDHGDANGVSPARSPRGVSPRSPREDDFVAQPYPDHGRDRHRDRTPDRRRSDGAGRRRMTPTTAELQEEKKDRMRALIDSVVESGGTDSGCLPCPSEERGRLAAENGGLDPTCPHCRCPTHPCAGIVAHSYMKRYEKVRKSANQRRTGNYE